MAALVGITPNLRAVLPACSVRVHGPALPYGRRTMLTGSGLMRAKAFHFEIAEPGIDRVAERGSSARQGEAALLYTQSPSAKVCRPSWIPLWR